MNMHWIYAHLLGDYIFQNDFMAQNKKKSSLHCLLHVCVYTIPFLLCGLNWWQLILIATQHYVIDRTDFVTWFMDVKGSHVFATNACFPWSVIVTDNILHILWIAFVAWIPELISII